MRLPRYKSQALPQESTISPAAAASGAAAMSAALAGATGEIAGVVQRIAQVQATMEANRKLAEFEERISSQMQRAEQVRNRPYLSSEEFGGMDTDVDTPTDLVLEREWRDLHREISGVSIGNASWSQRREFEQKRDALLRKGAIEIAAAAQAAKVLRARVDGTRAAQILQNIGNYEGARQIYDLMYEDGLIDYEARDKLVFGSHASEDENTAIQDALSGGKSFSDIMKAVEASPYLGEDEKLRIGNRINSIFENQVREQLREERRRSLQEMLELWSRIETVTRDEVRQNPYLSEEHGIQLMQEVVRRGERPEQDDPDAVRQANLLFVDFLRDPSKGREYAIKEITNLEGLSSDTVLDMVIKVDQFADRRAISGELNEVRRQLAVQLMGTEDPASFRLRFQKEQIADQMQALLAQAELDAFTAQSEQGIEFNATRWFFENIQQYRDLADSIMDSGTLQVADFIVRGEGNRIDREASQAAIRASGRSPEEQARLASQLQIMIERERSR